MLEAASQACSQKHMDLQLQVILLFRRALELCMTVCMHACNDDPEAGLPPLPQPLWHSTGRSLLLT